MSLSSLSGSEASAIVSVLQEPADKFGNDATVEMLWAMKAHHHAETYYNLLLAVPSLSLRLTQMDSDIYKEFRSQFTDMNVESLDVELVKSPEGKDRWRTFCNLFEGQVEDWNMATLLRIKSSGDISEDNIIIVPRIQFLAIEIARNREGLNESVKNTSAANADTPQC